MSCAVKLLCINSLGGELVAYRIFNRLIFSELVQITPQKDMVHLTITRLFITIFSHIIVFFGQC